MIGVSRARGGRTSLGLYLLNPGAAVVQAALREGVNRIH